LSAIRRQPLVTLGTLTVIESSIHSLKYGRLYRHEIEQTTKLGEEVATNLSLYNEVRPHQTLGQRKRSSCTAQIHTYFAAKSPKRLTPYTREEAAPGGLVLAREDVETEDLALTFAAYRCRDHDGGAHDALLLTGLHAQGVEPHVRIGALVERPAAEGRDLLV